MQIQRCFWDKSYVNLSTSTMQIRRSELICVHHMLQFYNVTIVVCSNSTFSLSWGKDSPSIYMISCTSVNTKLEAHFQFKLPLFVHVYFPIVSPPKSTVQVQVSGDWVTSPAFKRILFCEAGEMDHGANLFWHCHAGGSAVHSGKANREREADHFAYPALIVILAIPSGVDSDNCS